MNMEKFTTLAQQSLSEALALATTMQHAELSPLHLLSSLIADEGGISNSILNRAGGDAQRIAELATAQLNRMPTVSGTQPQTSQAVVKVLQEAMKTAQSMGDSHATVEHLLLALATENSDAKEVLELGGVTRANITIAIDAIRKESGVTNVTDAGGDTQFEALSKYGIDLNGLARIGKLDPVIGRDEEIRRCMQVLSRR